MEKSVESTADAILKICEKEDISLFVGAGISMDNPANLPTSAAIKRQITNLLARTPPEFYDIDSNSSLMEEYINTHALEHLMQDLIEVLGKSSIGIFDVFKHGEPNLYHLLIAKMAALGIIKRVFTTNFDILIEKALTAEKVKYHAFETDHDFADYLLYPEKYHHFPVFKLHGTITFTEAGQEKNMRTVEAISELKFQMRELIKYVEQLGITTSTIGFDRTVTPPDTLIGSLAGVGLALSQFKRDVLLSAFSKSVFVVIGWNGFDLDISPLFLEHKPKVYWIAHKTNSPNVKPSLSNKEDEIDHVVQLLKGKGLSPTYINYALLAIGNLPLDVLPCAEEEINEIVRRGGGELFEVFTPDLVRRLWECLSSLIGQVPAFSDTFAKVQASVFKSMEIWSDSVPPLLRHWCIAKFMLYHGEYQFTRPLLTRLVESIREQGFYDIKAFLLIDLADLYALHGDWEQANNCYDYVICLYKNNIQGKEGTLSGGFRPLQLAEIPERAFFGMGILACDFFRFKEAELAFSSMPTDKSVVAALVHFCREEFDRSLDILAKLQFRTTSSTKFHYYLYCYLRLIDADMLWLHKNYNSAETLYLNVLSIATKVCWPRHVVHALNGLSKTYSAQDCPNFDRMKAAKYAAQAIKSANMAEYRVGRAFAGYYFSQIYTSIGMYDIAEGGIRFAKRYFAEMEHKAGLDIIQKHTPFAGMVSDIVTTVGEGYEGAGKTCQEPGMSFSEDKLGYEFMKIFDHVAPFPGIWEPRAGKEHELRQVEKVIRGVKEYTRQVGKSIQRSPGIKVAGNFENDNSDAVGKLLSWYTSMALLTLGPLKFTVDIDDPETYEELSYKIKEIHAQLNPFKSFVLAGVITPCLTTLEEYDGIYNISRFYDAFKVNHIEDKILRVSFWDKKNSQNLHMEKTELATECMVNLFLPSPCGLPKDEVLKLRKELNGPLVQLQNELMIFIGESNTISSVAKLTEFFSRLDDAIGHFLREFEVVDRQRQLSAIGLMYSSEEVSLVPNIPSDSMENFMALWCSSEFLEKLRHIKLVQAKQRTPTSPHFCLPFDLKALLRELGQS